MEGETPKRRVIIGVKIELPPVPVRANRRPVAADESRSSVVCNESNGTYI